MKAFSIQQVQSIDRLIRNEDTGSTQELAGKLGMSERSVNQLIDHLRKDLGYPIGYSRIDRSYYYYGDGLI